MKAPRRSGKHPPRNTENRGSWPERCRQPARNVTCSGAERAHSAVQTAASGLCPPSQAETGGAHLPPPPALAASGLLPVPTDLPTPGISCRRSHPHNVFGVCPCRSGCQISCFSRPSNIPWMDAGCLHPLATASTCAATDAGDKHRPCAGDKHRSGHCSQCFRADTRLTWFSPRLAFRGAASCVPSGAPLYVPAGRAGPPPVSVSGLPRSPGSWPHRLWLSATATARLGAAADSAGPAKPGGAVELLPRVQLATRS